MVRGDPRASSIAPRRALVSPTGTCRASPISARRLARIDCSWRIRSLGISTAGVPGAIVGHHKISVKAEADYDQTQISMGPSLIPRRYNNPDTSELTAEVRENEKNEIPLKLHSGT